MLPLLRLIVVASFLMFVASVGANTNEAEAKALINKYNTEMAKALNELALKAWESQINVEETKHKDLIAQDVKVAKLKREMRDRALTFDASAMGSDIQRQLAKIKDIGVAAQTNETAVEELARIMAKMNTLYNEEKYSLTRRSYLSANPGVRDSLSFPGDYNQFITSSVSVGRQAGKKMKKFFTDYVKLSNDAIKLLGHNDLGAYWRSQYGINNLEEEVKRLYKEIRPLYRQLHTYVRTRLIQFWGSTNFPKSGQIPESVLGGVTSDSWGGVYSKVEPFNRSAGVFNFRESLVSKGFTVQQMFKTAESFLTSMGFSRMLPSFWEKSVLERPYGRVMDCHPSAWDFYDGKDYRIKMCSEVKESDFVTAHHEMAHIAYFMAYKDLPLVDRDGANPAIHEAIGDLIGLSVLTPEHLKKLEFISEVPKDRESNLNILMYKALHTVAYIPFAYFVDAWRWSVFNGSTTEDTYMKDWYRLRCELTGISPLGLWTEKEFYPGILHQIPASVPLMRYFFGFFLQFQFHKVACAQAKYKGPIHRCDIYNSTAAGKKLKQIMKLGSSKPWPQVLKQLTGKDTISSKPLLDYFKPLLRFLKKKNVHEKAWKPNC